MSSTAMQLRVRIASALVFVGLVVQLASFHWLHPKAFLVFAMVGIPLVVAGILVFLYSLVSVTE